MHGYNSTARHSHQHTYRSDFPFLCTVHVDPIPLHVAQPNPLGTLPRGKAVAILLDLRAFGIDALQQAFAPAAQPRSEHLLVAVRDRQPGCTLSTIFLSVKCLLIVHFGDAACTTADNTSLRLA
jgi:hypothetical protein